MLSSDFINFPLLPDNFSDSAFFIKFNISAKYLSVTLLFQSKTTTLPRDIFPKMDGFNEKEQITVIAGNDRGGCHIASSLSCLSKYVLKLISNSNLPL